MLRRCYGVRLKMLHERESLLNGLAMMWNEKAEPLDPEAFCWIGRVITAEDEPPLDKENDPQSHVVNVMAAEILRNGGHVDVDALMKTWATWTGKDEQEQANGE